MITNFLYCIDFPAAIDNVEVSDKVVGWLLCSRNVININISDSASSHYLLEFGLPRPDVAFHFKDFPNNTQCGFAIIAEINPVNLKKKLELVFEVEAPDGKSKSINIALDLSTSTIRPIEVDDDENYFNETYKRTEEEFINTLKKKPWLTIRMDITNKCNLRCIMCHYKEEEIYSRHTKAITAEQLKHQLQEIAPFVKHIMLSCGFEPLMSKHFYDILKMLHTNYPHMEIAYCTNAMLLNSKARKETIENDVAQVVLSLDGVTKHTLEKIRAGSDFTKIISNIKALHELKLKNNRKFPLFYINFVLMNSNIHEAPAFVELCASLGADIIDFRHLVGNIYFSEHDEMLGNNKAKYNYFRQLVIDASKKFNIDVRLPEPFDTADIFIPEDIPLIDLSEFNAIVPDVQTEKISDTPEMPRHCGQDSDFEFLSGATCLRPFNEIMIVDQEKIMPCSYYSTPMGHLDDENTLYSIFFNGTFKDVRRRKLNGRFDHNCINCPIKLNLLPTEVVK